MPHPALVAVSHGTADPEGAAAIALLVRRVAERLPGIAVHEAFVDVQQPEPSTVLATTDGPVVIVPLLLSQGFHVRVDLGRAVDGRPDAILAAPLGPDPRLAEVLAARLAGSDPSAPVVLAVAGSRDPASQTDAESMAALLSARLGRDVAPAYLAARAPSLAAARAVRPWAVVSTYLLAHGYFFDVTRRIAGPAATEPLLDDAEPPAALVDLVVDRYRAAAALLADGARRVV
ncbi:sirohydrochlorin chelatase [uncultured Microbacterium sp.]|uniref:sirohydrochlorin chelatase n=1 Tax=uncultured Microbacterium sp. TaxID=191216 RepID=UPI0025EA0BCF|nr:CbiX/SirB N-terminal domain-containing protein [uncultured Microbacterium sp.]